MSEPSGESAGSRIVGRKNEYCRLPSSVRSLPVARSMRTRAYSVVTRIALPSGIQMIGPRAPGTGNDRGLPLRGSTTSDGDGEPARQYATRVPSRDHATTLSGETAGLPSLVFPVPAGETTCTEPDLMYAIRSPRGDHAGPAPDGAIMWTSVPSALATIRWFEATTMCVESGDHAETIPSAIRCLSEPSTFDTIVHVSKLWSAPSSWKYATRFQSGERSPSGMPGIRWSPPPSGLVAPTVGDVEPRIVENTICVPFGDHCGCVSPSGPV